jgi:hypothetical protein
MVCPGAGGVYWTYNQASALPRIDVGASLSPSTEPGEPQNVLLVGIDDGTGLEAGDPVLRGRTAPLNTDTVMILGGAPPTPPPHPGTFCPVLSSCHALLKLGSSGTASV